MKQLFLPTLLGCFAVLSITTLYGLDTALATKQLVFFLLGAVLFYIVKSTQFVRILSLANIFYGATVVLLIVVLFFSGEIRNTNRWINLGFFNLQPSQLAIPAVALVLSKLVQTKLTLRQYIIFLLTTSIPAALVFVEPDLSMTLLVLLTGATIFWLQPVPKQVYFVGGVLLSLFAVLSWIWLLEPYQKQRIESFMTPSETITAASYNVTQSIIAIGSGRVLGRGMQRGTQSQLSFLPEKETDFIFASFSEESGWIGSMFILTLYANLLWYVLSLAKKTASVAGKTFLISMTVVFLAQITINIGMNLGLLPVTGVALPLMSYGGSSLIITCFMLGIAQSIANQTTNRLELQIE